MNKKYLIMLLGIFLIGFVFATGIPDPYGDYDSDGVLNKDDNCYYVYNPFQTDSDNDGWGNCCDSDYSKPEGVNWCDDPNQNQEYCGNGVREGDEQCDDGNNNGIMCDNSSSSCYYCSSECELINLPYEQKQNKITKPKTSRKDNFIIGGCEPNWKCTGWSECSNGFMSRNCQDTNNCLYSYGKPIERTGCETTSTLEGISLGEPSEEVFFSRITGAAIVFIILIMATGGLIFIRFYKPRRKHQS